jgi:hypothetical protein
VKNVNGGLDLFSVGKDVKDIDFGGAINLSGNYNVNNLNSFFNEINVENGGKGDKISSKKIIKSNLNDILSDFSSTEVDANYTNQIQINADNIKQNI